MSILSDHDAREFLGVGSDDALVPMIRKPTEKAVKSFLQWNPERHTVTKYYPKGQVGGEYSNWPGDNAVGGDTTWPKRGTGVVSTVGGISSVLHLDDKFVIPTGLVVYEYAGAYMGQVESDWGDALTLGTDYWLELEDENFSETGHLMRLGASWPKQPGSVKVTYSAGFTADQLSGDDDDYDASDIRLATLIAVQKAYIQADANRPKSNGRASGPIISETIQGYSYTLASNVASVQLGMARSLPAESRQLLQRYKSYRL